MRVDFKSLARQVKEDFDPTNAKQDLRIRIDKMFEGIVTVEDCDVISEVLKGVEEPVSSEVRRASSESFELTRSSCLLRSLASSR